MENNRRPFVFRLILCYKQYLYKTRKLSVILLVAVFLMLALQIFNGIKGQNKFDDFMNLKIEDIEKINCNINGYYEIRDIVIDNKEEISEIIHFTRNGLRLNKPKHTSAYSDTIILVILLTDGRSYEIVLERDEGNLKIQIIYHFYGGGYYFEIVDNTNLVERLILSK